MINVQESIRIYKSQGMTTKEAAAQARLDLLNAKIAEVRNNKAYTKKQEENPNGYYRQIPGVFS